MVLSSKAIFFLIEAINHYQNYHETLLQNCSLSEDEKADLINDWHYLEAIKSDLKAQKTKLLSQR